MAVPPSSKERDRPTFREREPNRGFSLLDAAELVEDRHRVAREGDRFLVLGSPPKIRESTASARGPFFRPVVESLAMAKGTFYWKST